MKQFNKALRILFDLDTPQDIILQKYMDTDAYVLTIDDGRRVLKVTDQGVWSNLVERDTTIVMNIIITQRTHRKKHQCPFCGVWSRLKENYEQSINWWAFRGDVEF